MFSKILIANRGEIALRIIRACKELGIRTVAVYSEADRESLHVQFADEAICIGPSASSESYLDISRIISAAEISDADAIHPGYGFLAENPHFAEICEECGIVFIGPRPQIIRLMGDKIQAKKVAKKAGVPIIPGTLEPIKSKEEVLKVVHKIRYPVIIKAASGGGGRGMRICHSEVRLLSSFVTAQNEADKAFGDGSLYIEKFIEEPRHIEVQIVADNYGNVIYLGERECSIQRRHQKLIEEAPSPAIDARLRRRIGEWAVRLAKTVNYNNLGTVEFLMDKDGKIYFIEMNTRIQVEHPITEEITGIDLVKLQIQLAAGEKLSIKQDDVKIKGHALECRINCEDPYNNFLPSPGKIEFLTFPGGKGVRIDTAIYAGWRVPSFYDSLLAKLIAFSQDRIQTIKIMRRALDEFIIEPLKTTIDLYKDIIDDKDFIEGNYNTSFLSKFLKEERVEV